MSTKLQYPPGTRSILMLEHDDDDRYITQATFDENHYKVRLHFVDNSNDLFAFLISCERNLMALPSLILLNHNAAPSNAVDITKDLRANRRYAHIPIVVLSGIINHGILEACYSAGCDFGHSKTIVIEGNKRKDHHFCPVLVRHGRVAVSMAGGTKNYH